MANSCNPFKTYFGEEGEKSVINLLYIVKLGASTKKLQTPYCVWRSEMNAPINLVLPTPVAKAKQSETKSRSKSKT